MIKRFFNPPVFETEEDNFRARFINGFAWAAIALLVVGIIPNAIHPTGSLTTVVLAGLIGVMAVALYLLHRRFTLLSGYLIVILGWFALGFQAATAAGVRDVIIIGYITLGLLASIVISWRAGGIVILSSLGVIWLLALLETNGYLTPEFQEPYGYARNITLIFVSIAVLVYFSTSSLRAAIRRAIFRALASH